MKKENYLQHIADTDLKGILIKILDKAEAVIKYHHIKASDFLNPYELKVATDILSTLEGIKWIAIGGYQEAERKILVIFQDYIDEEYITIPIAALEITSNKELNNLNHRDYLGALLSLGIKREKIGDILVHKNICYIIIRQELKDYIAFSLDKVKNVLVNTREIKLEEIKPPVNKYKEISGTVASLRLDSIISLGFNISRTEAQELIAKEKTFINWNVVNKNFQQITNGDIVSVRGKGRVIVEEIQGKTKSGRIHVKLKKPI